MLVVPVDRLCAVDDFEHGGQPCGQFRARPAHGTGYRRHGWGVLLGRDAVPSRRAAWRTRERCVRVEAEHDLEHERRPHHGVDRRVRAREQHLQSPVGISSGSRSGSASVVATRSSSAAAEVSRSRTGCELRRQGGRLGGVSHAKESLDAGIGQSARGKGGWHRAACGRYDPGGCSPQAGDGRRCARQPARLATCCWVATRRTCTRKGARSWPTQSL
jgi:hypothetical protein